MDSVCGKIRQDLQKILAERDRLYPLRDSTNDASMHAALDQYWQCLEDRRSTVDWSPDNQCVAASDQMVDNAVFLCGAMKSGTTLVLGLLDGHPELTALPGDSFLWNRFSEKNRSQIFDPAAWRKHWLKRFVNPTGQHPFWMLGDQEEAYISLLKYFDYWFDRLPDELRSPVLATVVSYFCANPKRSPESRLWVEKTPGNEFWATTLTDHFPGAKFIHIVRDPRENFASIKRLYKSRGWSWDIRGMAQTLARSYDAATLNKESLGQEKYLVLRYEDLTASPRKSMEIIAAFLGIEWHDSLLVPTVNSHMAKANTMYKDRQVTGVVRRSVNDKWRRELTAYEQGVIYQTQDCVRKLGYNWTMNFYDCCKRVLCSWVSMG